MLLMELTKYVLIRKDGVLSRKIMGGAGLEIDHIIEKCPSTLRIAPPEVDMVIQKMSMRIRVSVLNVLITITLFSHPASHVKQNRLDSRCVSYGDVFCLRISE